MSDDFTGIRALVTGAATGIGAATAAELASRGARVACLDLTATDVQDPLYGVAGDVTDDVSVRAAVENVVRAFGGLDVVVNNAGVGAVGSIEANGDHEWFRLFDVNCMGMVRVSRAALPHLRQSEHAAIVNVGSIGAWLGLANRAAYCASKGAVHALTLAMATDHLVDNIRVNCVHPGTADTQWVRRILAGTDDPAREEANLNARQPIGRLLQPREIAHAIAYLASPLASATTGVALGVDGGMHSLRPPAR